MTTTTADALQVLVDRQAIADCMLRYARGVDRLDEELIRSAFHPDAHDSHGTANGSVDGFLEFWLPQQADRVATQHYVMNQAIELDGDGANVETYFLATIKLRDSDELDMVGGRYVDRFEKRDGDWRIATRVVLADWRASADASRMTEALSRSHKGLRSAEDASYERPVEPRHSVA